MKDMTGESLNQYLTFVLSDEVYGVQVSQVKEVLELITITKVPRMPGYMRGVINLRGGVVPVVDLGLKFGMQAIENTVDTCIIVLEITLNDSLVVVGALADSVREVIELDPNQIEPAPKLGTSLDTEFIKGIGKQGDAFIILLDIDRIFSSRELLAVEGGRPEAVHPAGKAEGTATT